MDFKTLKIGALCVLFPLTVFSQLAENKDSLYLLDQRVSIVEDALVTSKKLKISGYIQTQWQSAQIDSAGAKPMDAKVGEGRDVIEKNVKATEFNRFGVRRGRVKFLYEDLGCQGVLQLDITEGGVGIKDAYFNILDPWVGYVGLKTGLFDRPFGYEISYSSSRRESPERSRIFQTLFPDERDLGAMLTVQGPKGTLWNVLKLEAGLFAGNGIRKDNDSKKDFIGHIAYTNSTPKFKYAVGASYYNGSVAQLTKNIYSISDGKFTTNVGDSTGFSKREYYGFDAQFSMSSFVGVTTIKGEYLFGNQPGNSSSASSPSSKGFYVGAGSAAADTYLRKFTGGYVHLVQDIADTKHSIVVKYDWYDPNTQINGAQIVGGSSKTGIADMSYSTLGLGYMYRMNNNVRLMAYYDITTNEKTVVKNYMNDLNDNLVTVRLQYKF